VPKRSIIEQRAASDRELTMCTLCPLPFGQCCGVQIRGSFWRGKENPNAPGKERSATPLLQQINWLKQEPLLPFERYKLQDAGPQEASPSVFWETWNVTPKSNRTIHNNHSCRPNLYTKLYVSSQNKLLKTKHNAVRKMLKSPIKRSASKRVRQDFRQMSPISHNHHNLYLVNADWET
jgi:hypothetical protein